MLWYAFLLCHCCICMAWGGWIKKPKKWNIRFSTFLIGECVLNTLYSLFNPFSRKSSTEISVRDKVRLKRMIQRKMKKSTVAKSRSLGKKLIIPVIFLSLFWSFENPRSMLPQPSYWNYSAECTANVLNGSTQCRKHTQKCLAYMCPCIYF